ncbi:MAG: HEAT repeat protein [Planctomycetota bacterium]|jgi:HEAT repeat protein
MKRSRASIAILGLTGLLALSVSCTTTRSSAGTRPGSGEWLDPSPTLRSDIESHAHRLPWVHGLEERVEIIQWFAGVGEPAYPVLLELAIDTRPGVAGSALAALGATGDARLVEHLQDIELPDDAEDTLRLELARALLTLGDWVSAMPTLIEGLQNEELYVRALALRTLSDVTGHRHDYDARAEVEEREEGVARWQQWWARQSGDPMQARGT